MTLEAFAELISFSAAHLSEVERGRTSVSEQFVAACDEALEAGGALLELLPSVVCERAAKRHRNQARRRESDTRHTETGDALVDEGHAAFPSPAPLADHAGPVGAFPLGSPGTDSTPPVSLIPPEAGGFVIRWRQLLDVFVASERVLGARPVIIAMAAELPMLQVQREAARGEKRTELLRAEARWAEFVSWLSDNLGAYRSGRQWLDRARDLALEADDRPMVAYVLMRKSQQALEHGQDFRGAINLAEAGQGERELPPLVRALSAVREAHGHAILLNRGACMRKLNEAHDLIERRAHAHDLWWTSTGTHCTHNYVWAYEGHCWLQLHEPAKAVGCFQKALAPWPGIYRAEEALQRTRLAIAHAANNAPDQAASEGQRALEIHQAAPSSRALVDLARLDEQLAKWPMVADVQSFREGFTTARRGFDAAIAH